MRTIIGVGSVVRKQRVVPSLVSNVVIMYLKQRQQSRWQRKKKTNSSALNSFNPTIVFDVFLCCVFII